MHRSGVRLGLFLLFLLASLLVASAAAAQDPAAERLWDEARRQEQGGDVAAALEAYTLLVRQFPNDRLAPRALLQVLDLAIAQNDGPTTQGALKRLLADYPRTAEAAEGFVRQGELQSDAARTRAELETALATFRRVPLLFGREAWPQLEARMHARVRSGELSLMLGDTETAASELVAAIEDEPRSRWTRQAQLRFASVLLARGEWRAASEILQELASARDDASVRPADQARARRLLSLVHRRILRPLFGQGHWPTAVRFPASGLELREPAGVAAAEDGRVLVLDGRQSLLTVLGPDGQVAASKEQKGGERLGWTPDGRAYVVTSEAIDLPFTGGQAQFTDPRPGKEAPLKGLRAAVAGPFGDWYLGAKGYKSLLTYENRYQGRASLLAALQPEIEDLDRDRLGQVYVLDRDANTVLRLGLDGKAQVVVRGSWKKPAALAVDELGNLYVLDRGTAQLELYDASGNRQAVIGPLLGAGLELRNPVDVAVDGSGRVYVADTRLPHLVLLD